MKDYVEKNYSGTFNRGAVTSFVKKRFGGEVNEEEEKQKLMQRFITKELSKEEKKKLKNDIRNKKRKELAEKVENDPQFDIVKRFLHTKKGTCRCQILRSSSAWSTGIRVPEHSILNAYISLISKAKKFVYIENQFFMSNAGRKGIIQNKITKAIRDRIVKAKENREDFKVYIFIPLMPGFEGDILADGSQVLKLQIMFQQETIVKGSSSLYEQLRREDIDPKKYVYFFGLRNHDMFNDGPKTEMIYIHSKCLVVDDRYVIIGSANINDRSMLGTRDSEVCILVEDEDKIDSVLNGEEVKVSKIVHEFRKRLMSRK
jgi:phospholipase D1/2